MNEILIAFRGKALLQKLIVLCFSALVFVWPLPDSIAIRNMLMLGGAILLVSAILKHRKDGVTSTSVWIKEVFIPLLLLTAWMFFVALFISPESQWSLDEIRGHWILPLISLLLGLMVTRVLYRSPSDFPLLVVIIVFPLFIHVLITDVRFLYEAVIVGELSTRHGGLLRFVDGSYITNILASYYLTESVYRAYFGRRLINIGNLSLFLMIILTAVAIYVISARFGYIVLAALFFTTILLLLFYLSPAKRQRYITVLFLVCSIVLAITWFGIEKDPRTRSLVETLPIAWNIETNKAWLDWEKYTVPELESGEKVSHSNYMRVAWIHAGMVLIKENWLGYGFGRNVFGHVLRQHYGEGSGHSHSGVIDLGLGVGIPGLIFWYVTIFIILYFSYRAFKRQHHPVGLLLFLITVNFNLRMFVDSNFRDHMLQEYLFITGITVGLVFYVVRNCGALSATENDRRSRPLQQ